MSNFLQTIEHDAEVVGHGFLAAEHFVIKMFADAEKVKAAIDALPPDTKATFAKIITDLAVVTTTTVVAADAKFVSINLDIAAFNAIKQLVEDSKAGVKDAEAFFSTLGIKL